MIASAPVRASQPLGLAFSFLARAKPCTPVGRSSAQDDHPSDEEPALPGLVRPIKAHEKREAFCV